MAGSGLGGLARNRTGSGRVLFDSGDESGLWRRLWGSGEAFPEPDWNGLVLSDSGDGGGLVEGTAGEAFPGIGQEWAYFV